ncbi:MAG: hypothetical protein KC729_20580, partial [Candidatus Eisenbacteria bacterium]|nr:hypothetical protein [Candidatus Eisenbacteria bacterium]
MADRPQAVLRCSICGGNQRVMPQIEDEGWYECRFCGELDSVPGAGVLVIPAPGRRVAEVVRPGRRTIRIAGGPASRAAAFNLLIGLDFLGALVLAVTRKNAPHLLWWIGIPLYLAILGIVVIVWRSRVAPGDRLLHIDDDGQVTVEDSTSRGTRSVAKTTLAMLRARKEPDEPSMISGPGIVLHRSGHEIARLIFQTVVERNWVFSRLRAAARLTQQVDLGEELRCDGCGGSLGSRGDLAQAGAFDCPHCGTGLVYTHGGVHLPPLELDLPDEIEALIPRVGSSATDIRDDAAVAAKTSSRWTFRRKPRPATVVLPPVESSRGIWLWGILLGISWALLHWVAPWFLHRWQYFPILMTLGIAITVTPAVAAVKDFLDQWVARWEVRFTDT